MPLKRAALVFRCRHPSDALRAPLGAFPPRRALLGAFLSLLLAENKVNPLLALLRG